MKSIHSAKARLEVTSVIWEALLPLLRVDVLRGLDRMEGLMSTDTLQENRERGVLEDEFEHVPVPQDRRRSLVSVSAVWFGFPMILTNALFGGIYVAFLGFWTGVLAMLVGNVILSVYVGMLSFRAGSTGRSFALQAQQTFGKSGYVVVSGFLATLVIGWFAFQTGLTGQTLQISFGANALLMTLIAGVLYIAVTFVGIRALAVLGWVSAPLFVILAAVAIFLVTRENGLGDVFSYTPQAGVGGTAGALTFGAVVSVTIAGFIDSGTMTSDFTRWSKNGRQGALAAFVAFPIANMVSMLIGGVIGVIAAVAGIWSLFLDWLNLLGVLVPPLGVIIIMDQLVLRKETTVEVAPALWRPTAFISWILASGAGLLVNSQAPQIPVAVMGMVVAIAVYTVATLVTQGRGAREPETTLSRDLT